MSVLAENKKAKFDYELLEELEAGLVLQGHEVKSVRNGGINLKGSFVSFHNGDAWLTNAHIRKYKYAGSLKDYDPTKSRKLLLSKKQIRYLQGKSQEKGLTIVPISVYTKGPRIKVAIAIGRGKKRYDKRRSIKEREQKRTVRRALKGEI